VNSDCIVNYYSICCGLLYDTVATLTTNTAVPCFATAEDLDRRLES
jgi:hypothetical protein